jgi:hypothetical protein
LLSLTHDVQQSKADIKDVRAEIKTLREDLVALTHVVAQLKMELQHDRESAARERELQQLRLENILLRYERGLPPAGSLATTDQDRKSVDERT